MSTRPILSSLFSLPLLLGIAVINYGCGGGVPVPDAVYTKEDLNVPTVDFTELNVEGDPVLVGIGSSYAIKWDLTNPPVGAVVRLYLDQDDGEVDDKSILITPTAGIDALTKAFTFTPTRTTGTTGIDYFVVAQLSSDYAVFDETPSVKKLRIGEGGIIITNPASNFSLARGLPIDITWDVTNNICEELTDKAKIIKLYIDSQTAYRDNVSIEITPEDGINACLREFELMTGEINLKSNTPYYIIARMFIDGVEHSRVTSGGAFTTTSSLVATSPQKDVIINLQAVTVSWEVTGRDPTGLKVEILAQLPDVKDDVERIISNEFSAEAGAGTADGSKLPIGTYELVVRLFERDNKGAKVILDTAVAPGKIIHTGGYSGSFDLADMAAAETLNYSPIDGVVFKGFNINDQTGFDVAGIGNLDGDTDNCSDIMIFARHGHEYTAGDAGAGYLIYGKKSMPKVVNLNSIASPAAASRSVEGTLMVFPMENLSMFQTPKLYGTFKALGIPDVSGDAKGDLLIGCPEAAPLRFVYWHSDGGDEVTFLDHYGMQRKYAGNQVTDEPGHCHSSIHFICPDGHLHGPYYYPKSNDINSYLPGDTFYIEIFKTPSNHCFNITVHPTHLRRGTTYMLTSDRLVKYRNGVFDLAKVGSPSETDGLGGLPLDQMLVWHDMSSPNGHFWDASVNEGADVRFGADISMLPDRNGDGVPEILATAPEETTVDNSQIDPITNQFPTRERSGVGLIFQGDARWTNVWSGGHIGWMGQARYKANSDAWATIQDNTVMWVFGAEPGSELTCLTGLGRFNSVTDFGSYINGDFNNDNVPDMVAGSPGENNNAGCLYVIPVRPVFGHRIASIDLGRFNQEIPPSPNTSLEVPVLGVKVKGTLAGERLGEIVRAAGDFNGDGLADVIFSTPNADASGRAQAGRVFILFGQKDAIGDFSLEDVDSHKGAPLPGLVFEGQAAFDHLGTRICSVNDVNGDGLDDVLLAAPDADAPGKNDCGKAYLIYGRKNIIKTDPATNYKYVDYDTDGEPDEFWNVQGIGTVLPGAVFVGEGPGVKLQAIAAAGDANGDGIGDILLGAPLANVSSVQLKAGKAYLVFGRKLVLP